MSEKAPERKIRTHAGRVYQQWQHSAAVWIDWKPDAPIYGHAALTRGRIEVVPSHGTCVQFAEKATHDQTTKTGKKIKVTAEITVRASTRPDLLELVELARQLSAQLKAELDSQEAAEEAERTAARKAALDTWSASLPPGYTPLDQVEHNPSAADGWGFTAYRHAGYEITAAEVEALGARRRQLSANPRDLVVWVDAKRLNALVAEKQRAAAERATKIQESIDTRAAKFREARDTGKQVQLERWIEDCDGSAEDCSTDSLVRWALPDGSTKITRTHLH